MVWKSRSGFCGRIAASAIVVITTCLIATGVASASWSSPVTVAEAGAQYSFGQAVAPDGEGTVVWSAPAHSASGYAIYARGVSRAGAAGSAREISEPDSEAAFTSAYRPAIRYAADGTATVVWMESTYASESCFDSAYAEGEEGECEVDEYVKARQIAPGGSLSEIEDLYHRHVLYPKDGSFGGSNPAYMYYGQPALSAGPEGSIDVVWGQSAFGAGCAAYGYSSSYADEGCEAEESIRWVRLNGAAEPEGASQAAFSAGASGYGAGQPLLQTRAGSASDGTATVLFTARAEAGEAGCWGGESSVQVLQIEADGETTTPSELDSGCGSPDPHLVVQSDGSAVAAWGWEGAYSADEALYVRIASDGSAGAPEPLLDGYEGGGVGGIDLARGPAGSVTAVWADEGTIQSRQIPASGDAGTIETVATPGSERYFSSPRIALASDGSGALVWEATALEGGYATGLEGVEVAADGTPGTVRTLMAANRWDHGAHVSAGGDGSLMASWRVSVPHENKIQAVRVSSEATTANDDFSEAEAVPPDLPSFVGGSNEGATRQPGEPEHAGDPGGASVWYSWTPTASGPVAISTCSSDGLDSLLAVYTGAALDELTEVASADTGAAAPCASGDSEVRFEASAGTTYEIAVDGKGESEGSFGLKLFARGRVPPNDDFTSARTVGGAFWSRSDKNVDASRQAGEPEHAGNPGGASVWYTWTPSSDVEGVISVCGYGLAHPLLGAYTGPAVNALTEVASADGGGGAGCEGGSEVRVNAVGGPPTTSPSTAGTGARGPS